MSGAVLLVLLIHWMVASSELSETLESILSDPVLRKAKVGAVVRRLSDGKILFQRKADVHFIPASNQKIFTTASALDVLGANYQFRTLFGFTGTIEGELLKGDILVKGGGDPNISGRFFEGDRTALFKRWADKLARLGVKRVEGGIVLNDALFDRDYVHPKWPETQLAHWFCAPISALSFNDNCVDIVLRGGQGRYAKLEWFPRTNFVSFVNRVRVFGSGKTSVRIRRERRNRFQLRGRMARGTVYSYWVAVEEPTLYFGTVLKETLSTRGIQVDGKVRIAQTPQFTVIDTFTSGLARTIAVANKRSQNFYAECIFKLLGAVLYGTGSFENGSKAVGNFLRKLGFSTGSFRISDGSGLSRKNSCTPSQLASVLVYMRRQKDWEVFRDSLSIAGVDGTLRERFSKESLRGNVYGKTGTLAGVSALSGYILPDSENGVAFSLLSNGLAQGWRKIKAIEVEFCRAILSHLSD